MAPMSHYKLRGLAIGYEYRTDTDATNILRDVTTKDLHLVGKTNHEIFIIPKWLPPNVKMDIKLQLALSNYILKKMVAPKYDLALSLTSAIMDVRKQPVTSSVVFGNWEIKS